MQDLLRFFLALSVVIFHYKHFAIQSALSLPPDDYVAPFSEVLDLIYRHGYHAVAVFFFLSGYMLASRLNTNTISTFSYRNFLIKRLARIYPAHGATLLVMGLVAIIVNQLSLKPFMTYNDNIANFVASIFLLNGTGIMRDTSFNLPAWSLSVEVICYVAFGAVCALSTKRRGTLFFLGLLAGVAIKEISSDPNIGNVGSGMVFFFAGTIAAAKFKPLRDRFLPNDQIAITVLLGIFALSFSLSLYTSLGLQKLIWIFLSLPALVIAVTAIDDKLSQIKERPFLWLGLMSFSIYIWHFPVQAVMHYWINGAQIDSAPAYNSPILFWLYLVSIVAIAHLSLVSIEKWGSSCIRSFEKS